MKFFRRCRSVTARDLASDSLDDPRHLLALPATRMFAATLCEANSDVPSLSQYRSQAPQLYGAGRNEAQQSD